MLVMSGDFSDTRSKRRTDVTSAALGDVGRTDSGTEASGRHPNVPNLVSSIGSIMTASIRQYLACMSLFKLFPCLVDLYSAQRAAGKNLE